MAKEFSLSVYPGDEEGTFIAEIENEDGTSYVGESLLSPRSAIKQAVKMLEDEGELDDVT